MEVVIVGAGPAGWSLAAALRAEGVDVTLVAPEPHARWTAGYGAFADELEAVDCPAAFVWPQTIVRTDAKTIRLDRRYARVDADALQSRLVARAAGTRVVEDTVARLAAQEAFGRVATYRGDLVFDARGAPAGEAAQVAYGVSVELEGLDVDPEAATLMDFRTVDGGDEEDPGPTFLYALPRGSRVFVEETSLVSSPPVPMEALANKLERRLGRGVGATDEERCRIWMDTPPPPSDVGPVPFGAAAGFVHPATGYSLVRTLRTAPAVAAAAVHGPEAAIDAMWTESQRRAWAFQDFGRKLLLNLDIELTIRFFETFFGLPAPRWRSYLAPSVSAEDVEATMWAMFRAVPWALQWQISRAFVTRGGWRALRAPR
ncbi:MAG: lycopene cyclase family protein [Deltaproteobacteria bacterium]